MKKATLLSLLIRGFLIVCLIDLVLVGIVVMISWWTGWTNLENFRTAIQIAGLLVIALGLMGVKGNLDMSRSFDYQYSMSVTKKDSWERIQATLLDLAQSFSFMLIMFTAGLVCLVIGWLL